MEKCHDGWCRSSGSATVLKRQQTRLSSRRRRSIISYAVSPPPFALTQFSTLLPHYPRPLTSGSRSFCLRPSNRCSPFTVNSARRMPRANRGQLHRGFGVSRKHSCALGGHHQTLLPRALPRNPRNWESRPPPHTWPCRKANYAIITLARIPYANENRRSASRAEWMDRMGGCRNVATAESGIRHDWINKSECGAAVTSFSSYRIEWFEHFHPSLTKTRSVVSHYTLAKSL